MHLTFHTRLDDVDCHAVLGAMAAMHARVERSLYAEIAAERFNPKDFKRAFCAEHDLTSRQFNAMALEVKGKIKGTQEALSAHVEMLEARLKTTRRAISELQRTLRAGVDAKGRRIGRDRLARKRRNLHEKQRKAGRIEDDIAALRRRIEAPAPGICFGSRDLFREQFAEGADHAAWLARWRARRDSQLLLVGTAEEETGNASCQARLEPDGTVTLRLRPFNAMLAKREGESGKPAAEMRRRKTVTAKASDFVEIRGLSFGHGQRHIEEVLTRNAGPDRKARTALTWRFVRNETGIWYAYLSFEVVEQAVFDAARGTVGIDFNEDHVAATAVDRHGNFTACRRFPLNLHGAPSARARDMIRCVARDVVAWAQTLGLPIVAEDLDFARKKRSMAGLSARRSRQLSSLHYAAWGAAVQSRCLRDGIALRLVNPAYSSLIGRVRFARTLGLSVHHAAALVIARRGLQLSERLPHSPVGIPDGRGNHVTLDPVVNMGQRHVWLSWARVAKAVKAALAAQPPSRSGTSPATGQTLEQMLDDAIPDFPRADPGGVVSLGLTGEIPGRRPDLPVAGRLSSNSGTTAPGA